MLKILFGLLLSDSQSCGKNSEIWFHASFFFKRFDKVL